METKARWRGGSKDEDKAARGIGKIVGIKETRSRKPEGLDK